MATKMKGLRKSLANLIPMRDKPVDLRVAHISVKDELRCVQMRIAMMKREVTVTKSAAKENGSDAAASDQSEYNLVQYQ